MLVALELATPQAFAKAGDLDPSFGKGGKVTKAVSFRTQPWDSVSIETAAMPRGGTIALAGRMLYGFSQDGAVSRRFGSVKVAGPKGSKLHLSDIAVDSRGRILVAGGSRKGASEHAFVARYTPRGNPDPAFGDNGLVVTDFGLPGPITGDGNPAPVSQVQVVGIAVDLSDRVVLTGTHLRNIGPCRGTINLPYRDTFVARLNSSGRRDQSFGDAGMVSLAEAPKIGENTHGEVLRVSIQAINPPVVDASGKIYLSTRPTGPCDEGKPALVGRLEDSGQTDPNFGEGGWVNVSGGVQGSFLPLPIALDSRDRLLLTSQSSNAKGHKIAVVKRLLPSGALDQGFGQGGVARIGGPAGDNLSVADETVDHGNRVLIAGTIGRSFFLGRLTSTGEMDQSFGRSGRLKTAFSIGSQARASSVTIDARGRAVVAGTVASPRLPGETGLALARYLGGR
jgi:uncharacterized delta-60 repeat protein